MPYANYGAPCCLRLNPTVAGFGDVALLLPDHHVRFSNCCYRLLNRKIWNATDTACGGNAPRVKSHISDFLKVVMRRLRAGLSPAARAGD